MSIFRRIGWLRTYAFKVALGVLICGFFLYIVIMYVFEHPPYEYRLIEIAKLTAEISAILLGFIVVSVFYYQGRVERVVSKTLPVIFSYFEKRRKEIEEIREKEGGSPRYNAAVLRVAEIQSKIVSDFRNFPLEILIFNTLAIIAVFLSIIFSLFYLMYTYLGFFNASLFALIIGIALLVGTWLIAQKSIIILKEISETLL